MRVTRRGREGRPGIVRATVPQTRVHPPNPCSPPPPTPPPSPFPSCDTVFAVPGDYNLIRECKEERGERGRRLCAGILTFFSPPPAPPVLDQLIKAAPALRMRYTCNELNAGYAADGYARCK